MSRVVRMIAVAAIAMLTVFGAVMPASAQWLSTGYADFAAADGGSVVGGSFVITGSDGEIVRQGTIGDAEREVFFGTFATGETYTLTATANGYQAATQTLTFGPDSNRFSVVLQPLEVVKKTITIGVDKNDPTGWFLAEAPEGSTWTLTDIDSGKVYSGTFSGVVPQTIELSEAIGSGTYHVQVEAGPTFLPYEQTVTIRGNSGALYFPLEVNTAVVPIY